MSTENPQGREILRLLARIPDTDIGRLVELEPGSYNVIHEIPDTAYQVGVATTLEQTRDTVRIQIKGRGVVEIRSCLIWGVHGKACTERSLSLGSKASYPVSKKARR